MTSSFTKAIVCVAVLAAVGGFAQGATIGFWQFNEQSPGGQTTGIPGEILDSSANGHHGYAVGDPLPSYVAGSPWDLPSAIQLTLGNTVEDRIVVPHDDAFNFNLGAGDDFTLEAIIRTEVEGGIVTKRGPIGTGGGPGYCMKVLHTGEVAMYLEGTPGSPTYDYASWPKGVTKVDDGEWHHVAVTIDADAAVPDNNVIKIYVDWVLDATVLVKDVSAYGTGIADDLSSTYDVWIGDFFGRGTGDQFVGDIDVVRISSGALTPSEFIGAGFQIPGDANNDGKVNDEDASILAAHWQQTGMGWGDGDFNNDQIVNDEDASILAAHWQEGTEGAAPVPEPSTIMLLAVGGLALVVIRQRRLGFRR